MSPILQVLRTREELVPAVRRWKQAGKRLGLVPTMGALHAGHASLIRTALECCDVTVVTIFVNPTQFGPGEDFERYPRPVERDLELLGQLGVQGAFLPDPKEMYAEGHSTYIEPPRVGRRWEGTFRPGHFRGVATVCLKLFHLVPAEIAFFGQKDYQQLRVVETMARELDVPIAIRMCPTVREPDGLALSSRNAYLAPDERRRAAGIYQALCQVRLQVEQGERDRARLEEGMRRRLREHGIDAVDYAVVVDRETLEPVDEATADCVALIAAHVGATRLIDNMLLGAQEA